MGEKSILVVDDKVDILAFMQAALEGEGYEVATAPEGERALALMRRHPADLVITDIFMPGQEGMETIARCQAEFPEAKIIAMSAGSSGGVKQDFLGAAALLGVAATLRKPFNADQLLETVRKALQPKE